MEFCDILKGVEWLLCSSELKYWQRWPLHSSDETCLEHWM